MIGKRRRHTTSDSVDSTTKRSERSESTESKPAQKRGPGRPPKPKPDRKDEEDCDIDVCGLDDDINDVFTSSANSNQKSDSQSKNSCDDRKIDKNKSEKSKKEKSKDSAKNDKEQGKNKFYHNLGNLRKVSSLGKRPLNKSTHPSLPRGDGSDVKMEHCAHSQDANTFNDTERARTLSTPIHNMNRSCTIVPKTAGTISMWPSWLVLVYASLSLNTSYCVSQASPPHMRTLFNGTHNMYYKKLKKKKIITYQCTKSWNSFM